MPVDEKYHSPTGSVFKGFYRSPQALSQLTLPGSPPKVDPMRPWLPCPFSWISSSDVESGLPSISLPRGRGRCPARGRGVEDTRRIAGCESPARGRLPCLAAAPRSPAGACSSALPYGDCPGRAKGRGAGHCRLIIFASAVIPSLPLPPFCPHDKRRRYPLDPQTPTRRLVPSAPNHRLRFSPALPVTAAPSPAPRPSAISTSSGQLRPCCASTGPGTTELRGRRSLWPDPRLCARD